MKAALLSTVSPWPLLGLPAPRVEKRWGESPGETAMRGTGLTIEKLHRAIELLKGDYDRR